jgi:hypothetical protein
MTFLLSDCFCLIRRWKEQLSRGRSRAGRSKPPVTAM